MNNRLTIKDLASILSKSTKKDSESIERFLKELISIIKESAFKDKLTQVKGIGTFKIIQVEQRESVDVNTKERILIPSHYKLSYTPEKELREVVNKPFSFFESIEINDDSDFSSFEDSIEDKELVDNEDEQEEILIPKTIPVIDREEIFEEIEEPEEEPVLEKVIIGKEVIEDEIDEEVTPLQQDLDRIIQKVEEIEQVEEKTTLKEEIEPILEEVKEEISRVEKIIEEKAEPVKEVAETPQPPIEEKVTTLEKTSVIERTFTEEKPPVTETSYTKEKEEQVYIPPVTVIPPPPISYQNRVVEETFERVEKTEKVIPDNERFIKEEKLVYQEEEVKPIKEDNMTTDYNENNERRRDEDRYRERENYSSYKEEKNSSNNTLVTLLLVLVVILIVALGSLVYLGRDVFFKGNTASTTTTVETNTSTENTFTMPGEDDLDDEWGIEDDNTYTDEETPADPVAETPDPAGTSDIAVVKTKRGDRLNLLALDYYGNKLFWVYIYEHNKSKISNPNSIPVGVELNIPAKSVYGIDANDKESVRKAGALQTQILSKYPSTNYSNPYNDPYQYNDPYRSQYQQPQSGSYY